MNILITEDERIEREFIRRAVDTIEEGRSKIVLASNGEEGLKAAEKEKFDLIIVDIRMPGMDGLEMIERIRRFDTDVSCYILSSYDTFAYVRKAMRLDVSDFLLKPVDRKRLEQVLRETHERLQIQESRSKMLESYNEYIDELEERAEHDLCRAVITGKDPDEVARIMHLLHYERYHFVRTIMQESGSSDLLQSFIEERGFCCLSYPLSEKTVHFLFSLIPASSNDIGSIRRFFEERDIVCYIAKEHLSPEELQTAWQEIKELYFSRSFLNAQSPSKRKLSFMGKEFARDVLHGSSSICERTAQFLMETVPAGELSEAIRVLFVSMDAELIGASKPVLGVSLPDTSGIRSKEELVRLLEQIQSQIQKVSRPVEIKHSHPMVLRARAYIQQNYARPISLGDVADELKVSTAHLSRLLNQSGDLNFSQMVNMLRIAKAKDRIHSGDSFKEIAFETGFGSQSYFTKIFKKEVGLSPSEYRLAIAGSGALD